VGGSRSLRGYVSQRFAGDAALFGSAELRQPIGQVRLIARGRLGVIGFADAGRVYVDGDSPDGWHSARAPAPGSRRSPHLGVTYAKGARRGSSTFTWASRSEAARNGERAMRVDLDRRHADRSVGGPVAGVPRGSARSCTCS
jgi:hemolysin activation/secretion protein